MATNPFLTIFGSNQTPSNNGVVSSNPFHDVFGTTPTVNQDIVNSSLPKGNLNLGSSGSTISTLKPSNSVILPGQEKLTSSTPSQIVASKQANQNPFQDAINNYNQNTRDTMTPIQKVGQFGQDISSVGGEAIKEHFEKPRVNPINNIQDLKITVNKGDTLESLAKQYNTSIRYIKNMSGISDVNNIKEGQIIRVPNPKAAEAIVNIVVGFSPVGMEKVFQGGSEKIIKDFAGTIAKTSEPEAVANIIKTKFYNIPEQTLIRMSDDLSKVNTKEGVINYFNYLKNEASKVAQNQGIGRAVENPFTKVFDEPKTIEAPTSFTTPKYKVAENPYQGETDLTTNILKDLQGKTTVSKQYILDATNRPELKQVEKDLTRQVLDTMPGGQINVNDFANKLKAELLPLDVKQARDMYSTQRGSTGGRYENITLPNELRGEVKNYKENIYQSPIKTSAGQVHFGQPKDGIENYFGHTRIEDMADNKTRRVIEVQSDLYQKGNLEREVKQNQDFSSPTRNEDSAKAIAKLQQYNDPTAHFRMVREEIKKAAEDGKTKLQFPTGETAMKIEGLVNRADKWVTLDNELVNDTNIKKGDLITYQTHEGTPHEYNRYLITKNTGGGGFDAVDSMTAENDSGFYELLKKKDMLDDGRMPSLEELSDSGYLEDKQVIDYLGKLSEHLSAKDSVDTNNPIYKFYEKDLGRYLKNKYNATPITDSKGVTWYQVDVKPEMKGPVTAFKTAKVDEFTHDISKQEFKNGMRKIFNDNEIELFSGKDISKFDDISAEEYAKDVLGFYRNGKLGVKEDINGMIQSFVAGHEAGHGFFDLFTSPTEKRNLLDYIIKNKAEELKQYTSSAYNTIDKKAEEFLVDDFAKRFKENNNFANADGFLKTIYKKIVKVLTDLFKKKDIFEKFYDRVMSKDRSYVKPTSKTIPVKSLKMSSEENSLILEAKKYKSAEEFVNNSSKLKTDYDWKYLDEMQADKDAGMGYAHSDYNTLKRLAERYRGNEPAQTFYRAGSLNNNVYGEKLKDIYLTPNQGLAEQYARSGQTKVKEYIITTKNNLDATDYETASKIFGGNYPRGLANDPELKQQLIKYAKDNGYDSVRFSDSGPDGEGIAGDSLVVFDKKNIKTKSQLTDIWNKANSTKLKIGEGEYKLSEADRLMAEGKIRIVSRNGYDVYQIKKGGNWVNVRDEESAVKQLTEKRIPTAKEYSPVIQDKLTKTENAIEKVNPLPQIKSSQLDTTTGEGRSIEIASQQAEAILRGEKVDKNVSLPEIISKTVTPVQNKVHIIDTFLTTPKFVMEKIGFGKEAKALRTAMDKYWKELPVNLDKITQWSKEVPKESNERIFKWLDGEAIDLNPTELKVGNEIKTWLKEWAVKLDLPSDKTVSHYITHLFDRELTSKEFDEELAKIIADRIPGSVYDPFLLKRLGTKGYKQDTWAALDAYVKRATRKINLDPVLEDIQSKTGPSLDMSKIEKSQFEYIKKYIDNINMRPSEADEGVDNFIKSIIGYKFGQRPTATILRRLRQMTFRGALALNPASALRNLSQGANTYAELGEKYTVIGYAKLFSKGAGQELKDSGVLNAGFVQDRVLSSTKKLLEKTDKVLFSLFDTAEHINRGAAYFGAKAKGLSQGMSEQEAIDFAKEIVRKTQFVFDSVDTPVGMSSDIMKTLLQFQSFTTKQIEFLGGKAKGSFYGDEKLKNALGLLRYALAGLVFTYTIGEAFGMKPQELLPWYRFETPVSLKFPVEVGKALMDSPNKYGQARSTTQKLKDTGNSAVTLFPAGSQIKKTYQGIQSINQGGSFTSNGNLQFPIGKTNTQKAQAVLFGKYANQSAQDYFNKPNTKLKEQTDIIPIYNKAQALIQEGKQEEADALVQTLTDKQYEIYNSFKKAQKLNKNTEAKLKMIPFYQEMQKLKETNPDEADRQVNELSDEEYKVYDSIKKQFDKTSQ